MLAVVQCKVAAAVLAVAVGAATRAQGGAAPVPPPVVIDDVKAAFAAGAAPADPARVGAAEVCTAIVGAQSWSWHAGVDGGGEPIESTAWLPLGAMARLLVADACAAADPVPLDAVVARVGDRDLTVRALLQGTAVLPDCYAFAPLAVAVDASSLLACAEVAAAATTTFAASSAGIAELLVLEPHLLAAPAARWPLWLRLRLGPSAGIEIADLAEHADGAKARVALAPAFAAQVAGAPFAPLRLALTARDLTAWWEWRLRASLPHLEGSRSGRTSELRRHPGNQVWTWSAVNPAFGWQVAVYPDRGAALVQYRTGTGWDEAAATVQLAFETALFGEPAPAAIRWGGRSGVEPSLATVDGDWVAADGAHAARLEVREWGGWRLRLQLLGESYRLTDFSGRDPVFRVGLRSAQARDEHRLLLARIGEGAAERLRTVFELRGEHWSIPRRLDFVRAPATGEDGKAGGERGR